MSTISYKIKRSRRARKISITVKYTGDVVVTMPLLMPSFVADKFVRQKIDWIKAMQNKLKRQFEGKTIIRQTRKDYLENKKKALALITERIIYFNKIYKFKINRIAIKNQKSRWGSCSSKGNLNFNYALVHLPQELADYVIVHELCHLKEMNHGKAFWDLVAVAIPDWKENRAVLKKKFIGIQ